MLDMISSGLGIAFFGVVAAVMARADAAIAAPSRRNVATAWIQVAILVIGLVAVRYLAFDLLWFGDWRSAYLVLGLAVIVIAAVTGGRRGLAAIGFQAPVDRKTALRTIAVVLLIVAARLVAPLASGKGYHFDVQRLVSNAVIFALLEEAIFRGAIQTRLEAPLGATGAWIVTALLFGLNHYHALYVAAGRTVDAAAALQLGYLTAFGLLLGIVFARTRSLLPSFLLHAANNLSLL